MKGRIIKRRKARSRGVALSPPKRKRRTRAEIEQERIDRINDRTTRRDNTLEAFIARAAREKISNSDMEILLGAALVTIIDYTPIKGGYLGFLQRPEACDFMDDNEFVQFMLALSRGLRTITETRVGVGVGPYFKNRKLRRLPTKG